MKVIFAVYFAIVPLTAFAQVEAGTFVVLESSQTEIVVAADSRAIGWVKTDKSCKIRAFGNELIFAASCGGSVCLDRFFGFLSGKIVLVVVVAVGM
jgi:hypothetical protein